MTARPTDTRASRDDKAKAATTREAKGSVHEAIGKLIGDDAAQAAGTAERQAGAADASGVRKSSRP
ncbi:CsbD family protein [Microvirga sp. SRT01]|uniref:CsbD family protein n=1 Tax=Sphingomonas longa TaxID=2778730 RepID=A0ABS2DAQ9_9SPHN|nr:MULTISPECIES: hypothetical protein [Alphaproteobacteria]MBM6578033.1 hypothetical protein [Sphingomonas sp. BT552]MBR7711074.1 CsbD family protein [Microvirga sp. SRT01]